MGRPLVVKRNCEVGVSAEICSNSPGAPTDTVLPSTGQPRAAIARKQSPTRQQALSLMKPIKTQVEEKLSRAPLHARTLAWFRAKCARWPWYRAVADVSVM